ncbi:biotin/lipoyl-binding carrier protein [Saccharopolyspora sp. ASAGF58]|uniref:biotin/lipoyl-binding carrier protein n=1 Tax=Saccharopolyspora sp. ASAGF58 TaxID=2719023 RepID=UPI001FF0B6C2|nr:biotin/lipoyl-binding carrier protein [Saccharopolyspora sp. ASAGF58]
MATIHAEMTATIWKLTVAEGDRVENGETIAVLESMKMEIPVEATSAGTVRFRVAEGADVAEGAVIAEIDGS